MRCNNMCGSGAAALLLYYSLLLRLLVRAGAAHAMRAAERGA